MRPDALYEVGNTRIKCGRVATDGTISMSIFGPERPDCDVLPRGPSTAVVAGSNPERMDHLARWLRGSGAETTEITSYKQLPITIAILNPETVGIDRLLGAVAANRRRKPGRAAVTVDVGTAVTVNYVDTDGMFRGGLILPGPTTMAKSLHADTAKLPLLEELQAFPEQVFPAHPTANAITAGIVYAIGGAVTLAMEQATAAGVAPQLFLTGGGAQLVTSLLERFEPEVVPTLNLEGLLTAAESLP